MKCPKWQKLSSPTPQPKPLNAKPLNPKSLKPKPLSTKLLNPEPRYPSSTLLPFLFWVSSLKLNNRKKGTLTINGLLGNLGTPRAPGGTTLVHALFRV